MPSLPARDGRAWLVTVPCALVAVLLLGSLGMDAGSLPVALACGLAVLVTECFPLHFAVAGQRHTATFVEAPLLVGLVLSPGRMLAVALIAGILLSQSARRLPVRKVVFNVAQYGLAAAVAVQLADHLPGVTGELVGIIGFTLVNELAVQAVLFVVAGVRMGIPYRGRGVLWMLHVSVSTGGGLIVGQALRDSPGLALALLPMLLFVLSSQRESLRRTVSEAVNRSIAEHAIGAQSLDRPTTLRLITALTRDLLAADEAELLILDGPRPLLARDVAGQLSISRLPQNWLDQRPWFQPCLAGGTDGEAHGRVASIVLSTLDGPQALLAGFRRAHQEPLRDADLATLTTVAAAATKWLSRLEEQRNEVIELNAPRTPADALLQPQMLRLAEELDLLTARVGADRARMMPELDELQELLMETLANSFQTVEREDAVELGTWSPRILATP